MIFFVFSVFNAIHQSLYFLIGDFLTQSLKIKCEFKRRVEDRSLSFNKIIFRSIIPILFEF